MKLPKLYRPIKIRFSSLRNGLGDNYGVIFDIDTMVEREAMRVLAEDGWKWQIKNIAKLSEWDWNVYADKECLDEIGQDMDCIELVK